MNTAFFMAAGSALVLLGLGFVVIDYFLVRAFSRVHAAELAALPAQLPATAERAVRRRWEFCRAIVSHRMRRGGLLVSLVGIIVLLLCGVYAASPVHSP